MQLLWRFWVCVSLVLQTPTPDGVYWSNCFSLPQSNCILLSQVFTFTCGTDKSSLSGSDSHFWAGCSLSQSRSLILWSPCWGILIVPFTCGSVSCSALNTVVTLTLPFLGVQSAEVPVVLPGCRTPLDCFEICSWKQFWKLFLTSARTTEMFSCHCCSSHSLEAQGNFSVMFACLCFILNAFGSSWLTLTYPCFLIQCLSDLSCCSSSKSCRWPQHLNAECLWYIRSVTPPSPPVLMFKIQILKSESFFSVRLFYKMKHLANWEYSNGDAFSK